MTWGYRVVHRLDGVYALHEVHFDDDGEAWAMSEEPASFVADGDEGPSGVIDALDLAIRDAVNHPVFEEPEPGLWRGRSPRRSR